MKRFTLLFLTLSLSFHVSAFAQAPAGMSKAEAEAYNVAYAAEMARLQAIRDAAAAAAPVDPLAAPVKPGPGATKNDWNDYDNKLAAWNQRTSAAAAASQNAARQQVLQQQATRAAEIRAIQARQQSANEAEAAQRRAEQREQRLLDLIEEQNRLQALEILRRQGKLPK